MDARIPDSTDQYPQSAKRRRHYVGIALLGLAAIAAGAIAATRAGPLRPSPEAVARVGDYVITTAEFSDEYLDFLGRTGQQDLRKHRETVVSRMVNQRLLSMHGRSVGLDTTEAFEQHRRVARRKLLIEAHTRRNVLDTVIVTDADLRDMFVRVNTRLAARHLYAPTRGGVDELAQRLNDGESFEQLAAEIFVDPRLAGTGGSVGYFSFDEMDAAFEDAAFGLEVGEVSDPVRTAQGYSIIELTDRQVSPLITEDDYAKRRDGLARYVRHRKEALARRAYVDALRRDLDIEIDEDGLAFLTGIFRLQTDPREVRPPGSASEITLVRYTDGEAQAWTCAEFLDLARLSGEKLRARVTGPAELREFISGTVARETMVAAAEREGLHKSEIFRSALKREENRYIYSRIHEELISETVVSSDSVTSFYEEHLDDLMQPEETELWEIVVESAADRREVEERLGNTSFEQIAAEMSLRPGADRTAGRLGFVRREQLGMLADTVWATPEGSTIGPLEALGRFVFFKIGRRTSAQPSTLVEVYADIENELRQLAGRRYIRTVIDSLSTAIGVEIDRDLLFSLDPRASISS